VISDEPLVPTDHLLPLRQCPYSFDPKTTTTRGRNSKYEHSCSNLGFRVPQNRNYSILIILYYIIFIKPAVAGVGWVWVACARVRTRAHTHTTHTWESARVYKPMTGPNCETEGFSVDTPPSPPPPSLKTQDGGVLCRHTPSTLSPQCATTTTTNST